MPRRLDPQTCVHSKQGVFKEGPSTGGWRRPCCTHEVWCRPCYKHEFNRRQGQTAQDARATCTAQCPGRALTSRKRRSSRMWADVGGGTSVPPEPPLRPLTAEFLPWGRPVESREGLGLCPANENEGFGMGLVNKRESLGPGPRTGPSDRAVADLA